MSIGLLRRSLFAAAMLLSASTGALADEGKTFDSPARLLPATTVFYAEVPRPAEVIAAIYDHAIADRLRAAPEYKAALATPQAFVFNAGLKLVENRLGMTWREAVAALTAGGVAVAFDPATQGGALLIRARDEATLQQLRDSLLGIVRDETEKRGQEIPLKSAEYRGIPVQQLGDLKFALAGPWLIAVNKDELGRNILDRYLDGTPDSLAAHPQMLAAKEMLPSPVSGWVWANLQQLRHLGGVLPQTLQKTDNPVAELMIGGLLGTLGESPFALAGVDVNPNHLELSFLSPHKPAWIDPAREYYFGTKGTGRAPRLLDLEGTLLSLSAYRDLSAMWLRSGDLFVDRVDAGFAEANANLSTLFGGKDFGEDILGAFAPEMQLVVSRQSFDGAETIPAIRVPAFAAVFRLRESDSGRDEFRRMFVNLIGFLNIVGAMNGNPQMDLRTIAHSGTEIHTATFVRDRRDDALAASIHHNFSPSIAFTENRFVIASTTPLARQLVDRLASSNDGDAPSEENTSLKISFPAIARIVDDNRRQLIAQNMLAEGRNREDAERQIGLLIEGLSLLRDLEFRITADDQRASIRLKLSFEESSK